MVAGARSKRTGSRAPASWGSRSHLMKQTVLIIDDEQSIRDALAKALRAVGYETLAAADGNEAIMVFEQCRPDLILLDLNMPVKNGWDTFEAISTLNPLTPVIIITGRPGQLELAAAARVGALMEKPLNVSLLMETVHRLINEPLLPRLSRLAYGSPATICHGLECSGEPTPDSGELSRLQQLRKEQLDDLRLNGGS